MTNELEPCPCCGSTDPEIRYDFMPNNMWMCKIACWLDAPAVYVECIGVGNTKEEAYEMAVGNWNHRHKRTCKYAPHRYNWENGRWLTECGKDYVFDDELPNFCPHCGGEVTGGNK